MNGATCENHTYIARRPLRNDLKSLQHGIPNEGFPNSQIRNLSVASIAVLETILNRIQDDCPF
jgi:hypothetical protein